MFPCIWHTVLLLLLASVPSLAQRSGRVLELDGSPAQVFPGKRDEILAFVFARTDCPISNAYAPEVQRLCRKFSSHGVRFRLVYPETNETSAEIRRHLREYAYPCEALRDPHLELTKKAKVTVTPEVALFTAAGELLYHGRIDDRYAALNKKRPAPTRRDLENALAAAVEGKPVKMASGPAVGCIIEGLR